MTLRLESVPCPLCGSAGGAERYAVSDLLYAVPGRFRYVACDRCGMLRLTPRPTAESIDAAYPAGYEPYRKAIEDQTINPAVRWLRHRQLRTRCDQVTRLATAGKLLDVGCSTGLFLNEMRRYGQWELYGVEPSAEAARYARERFGLDVRQGRLEDAAFGDVRFDIITLWDVLEHLPDPGASVERLRDLLAPAGRLILSAPNLDSIDARIFGPCWTGVDPPRHLSIFRRRDLAWLLTERGLRVERMYCFYGRYTTFASSLRLLLRARLPDGALRRSFERTLGVWRYLTLPYFAAIDRLGRGAIVTVVASRA